MTNAPCRLLEWDTAFFGCRIGTITQRQLSETELEAVQAWAAENAIDCLYFLADVDHTPTTYLAEANGFHLMDVRMTLSQNRPPTWPPATANCRAPQAGDYAALRQTARTAYQHSRFFHDPHFSPERCGDLYEVWLQRSLLEGYANFVWIAELNQQAVGYLSCKLLPDAVGEISLIGVSEQARGQRIGTDLIQSALAWFWEQDCQQVHVGTQARNIGAQRLYQRMGFLTYHVGLWYHKWFSDFQVE